MFFLQKLNPDLCIWKIGSAIQLMQCVNFQTADSAVEIPLAPFKLFPQKEKCQQNLNMHKLLRK